MTQTHPARPILVTGGTGQIGSRILAALEGLGPVVHPRRSQMDLASAASIREAIRAANPWIVINAGGYTAVDLAETNTELCGSINRDAPGVIGEEMARLGGAVIHYSTDYVFDGLKPGSYEESDPMRPLSIYGETKADGERALARTGAPHLTFRTSWIYDSRGKNFMLTVLRLAREKSVVRIVNDQFGAPTWAASVAAGTRAVLDRLLEHRDPVDAARRLSGEYHMTAAESTSWYGFASEIVARDPRRGEQRLERLEAITATEYPTPARRPANSRLSNAKLESVFGVRLDDWRVQLAECMAELPK